jgi:hypothetical protein
MDHGTLSGLDGSSATVAVSHATRPGTSPGKPFNGRDGRARFPKRWMKVRGVRRKFQELNGGTNYTNNIKEGDMRRGSYCWYPCW